MRGLLAWVLRIARPERSSRGAAAEVDLCSDPDGFAAPQPTG
jgi:hypothetical protein